MSENQTPPPTPGFKIIFSVRDIFALAGRVLPYAKKYWAYFFIGIAATLILNAASVVQPYILKVLTDQVLAKPGGDITVLNYSLLILMGTAVVKGAFIYVQAYMMAYGTNSTVKEIRQDVYRHLQRLPVAWFDRQRLGDIIQRLTDDVRVMTELMAKNLILLMNDLMVSVSAIVYMLTQNFKMTLIAFSLTPVTIALIKLFDRNMESAIGSVTDKMAYVITRVQEVLAAIRVVKSFSREADEEAQYRAASAELYDLGVRIARVGQLENPAVEAISTVSLVIVIGYGAWEVASQKMTLGQFMAFWGYLMLASTPVTRLTQTITNLRRSMMSADRVFQLKDIEPEVHEDPNAVPLPAVGGEIAFEGVTFAYSKGSPVLRELDLRLPYGQVVAIVGPNGAGKSTLISLLSRFYDPSEGRILMDGHDLRGVQLKTLRQQIGYVLQDNILFSGTIRSNLTYGRPR